MNIAVILHLYYQDLWPEFLLYLKNIKQPFDLYVSLCVDFETERIQDTIKTDFPSARFIILENRGADIGPFFEYMNILIKENKEYDLLLKIHTKKSIRHERRFPGHGKQWRLKCIEPLIGSIQIVEKNIELLSSTSTGIIGAASQLNKYAENNPNLQKWIFEGSKYMNEMLTLFHMPITEETFFAGTMFWCKYKPLKKYISNFELKQTYFQPGDHALGNTAAHAGERLFCKFFIAEKLKVIGV